MSQTRAASAYIITPLGAGDLIDRAVRFYRSHFWTFVWIAAPPVVVGTLITIGWTILGRELFFIDSSNSPDGYFFSALFKWFGSAIIWLIEGIVALMVMGGASRNFVRHILFGEPVTFRETYQNTWRRFFGLFAASALIIFLLGLLGLMIFYFGLIFVFVAVALVAVALHSIPFLAFAVSFLVGLAIMFGTGWLFFLIASRLAYVPQIMLVEGQGVAAAVGRSASLASGNVKRLYALFIFTTLATYAALLLFYIPLGWYAYLNGLEVFTFYQNTLPAWYTIAGQVIFQASLILLMPVWMIGLCLLYVDERVRHEGYDIELMAARELGEIPAVPRQYISPLHPALAADTITAAAAPPKIPATETGSKSSLTTLGLN